MASVVRGAGLGPRLVLLVVCLALLVACGSNAVLGDESVLVGTVYLTCSQDCRDHGSCGKSEQTGKQVVLLGASPAFPGVSAVAFEGLVQGAAVEVLDTKVVAGIEQQSGQEVEIRFYRVDELEGDTAGWVPGFCVANQAP